MENLTHNTPIQSYVLGTYLAGPQPFSKLSVIIQIHLSDPKGVFLITMYSSLPNAEFLM